MKRKGLLKYLDFIILDFLILIASFFIAGNLRLVSTYWDKRIYLFVIEIELFAYAYAFIFQNPYKTILSSRYTKMLPKAVSFGFIQLLIVIASLFLFRESLEVSRLVIVTEYILYILFSIVLRYLLLRYLRKKARNSAKKGNKKLLVVTTKDNSRNVCYNLSDSNFDFLKILGLCVVDEKLEGRVLKGGFRVVCNYDELIDYVLENKVDEVYFDLDHNLISNEVANNLGYAGVTIHTKINMNTVSPGRSQSIEEFLGDYVITSTTKERKMTDIIIKRFVDIIGGLVGMLFVLIFTIIIGPIIKVKSPGGPIFYKQERVGLNGKTFYMYKFRSMIPNAEKHLDELKKNNRVSSDLMFKMENDPRIIPGIGNFIRRTSIDEFPQFLNVLKGDMSLVGTRPPTVDEWNKYELKHRIRMTIKPGITGLWQVSGRNNITDFDEVVALDTAYIDTWSLELDFTILVKTVIKLFSKKDRDEVM